MFQANKCILTIPTNILYLLSTLHTPAVIRVGNEHTMSQIRGQLTFNIMI